MAHNTYLIIGSAKSAVITAMFVSNNVPHKIKEYVEMLWNHIGKG